MKKRLAKKILKHPWKYNERQNREALSRIDLFDISYFTDLSFALKIFMEKCSLMRRALANIIHSSMFKEFLDN